MKKKSVAAALLLTFFFGPIGLMYATVIGGLLFTVVSVFAAFATFGLSLAITWPLSMVWAAIAVNRHNDTADIERRGLDPLLRN